MKWHEAMLGGYPLLFDDRYFIPQHIVICQIFFPYVVYSRVYPRFKRTKSCEISIVKMIRKIELSII